MSALVGKGMAKMGIADAVGGRHGRGRQSDGEARSMPRDRNGVGAAAATGAGAGAAAGAARGGRDSSSDSAFSLSEEERNHRKMRGKEILTAGLASIATVNAAHELYDSWGKREARRKAVANGTMTPKEAKRAKSKAMVQDAAAVGLAGLGVKGVVENWKDMNERRQQCHQLESKLQRHRRIAAERAARRDGGGGGGGGGAKAISGAGNTNRSRIAAGPHSSGAPSNGYGGGGSQNAPPIYQDGNPYAASGRLPPAQAGGPPGYHDDPRRY